MTTYTATINGYECEVRSHPHDVHGAVWSVTIDGDTLPERWPCLYDATDSAERMCYPVVDWKKKP